MQTSQIHSQVPADVQPPLADRTALEKEIQRLGDWFHNIDLCGVPTAPNHFLGDFPNMKWRHIAGAIPENLAGAEVLDIGCNGGFYSIELKKRGAERVLGIDVDDRYLGQARFAARTLGLEIEFEKRSVYEVDGIAGQFDYVLFMGVFYHLRYPVFALDRVVKKVRSGGRLVFQSMLRGSPEVRHWEKNYRFWETEQFGDPAWPAMYFVEDSYANDQTNWWIPNRAAAEAVLRSSGLEILDHPEAETWICMPRNAIRDGDYILDLELAGRL
ncbi:MAG TPA: TIGR04290 family methyltransferase [Candidatus Binatia bacterium]|nr:TIGR04290 family methyltransferase [Candidatus Binatia bacterium]